jgi:hypothetical protein
MDSGSTGRGRRGLLVLAAVVALLAVGAVIGVAFLGNDSSTSAPAPGTALGGGAATASCLAFSEEPLGLAAAAFDGTVAAIQGDEVTLVVNRWYRGESGDTVRLLAPELTGTSLVGAVGFVEGERYLVSGDTAGGLFLPAICGFSVTYSEEMAATFARAFG